MLQNILTLTLMHTNNIVHKLDKKYTSIHPYIKEANFPDKQNNYSL